MLTGGMLALVATVLIPIPDTDFDPTEVAVSWQVLTARGHLVVFSTESGVQAVADDIMLTGRGLDFWSKVPGLSRGDRCRSDPAREPRCTRCVRANAGVTGVPAAGRLG